MPIYQGHNSCYAKREGIYVKRVRKPGIDTLAEAAAILKLVLRDYRRGWTYDDDCGCCIIPMDLELFKRRARYVVTLAHKHGAPKETIEKIEDLVNYVIKYKRMPRQYLRKAKKMIAKVSKVKVVKPKKRRKRKRK